MTKAHNRGIKRKLKNGVRNITSHPIRKAGRFATKALGGIAGGTMGLAIGAATGNPSKALENAIIGVKGGTNISGRIADSFTVDDAAEAGRAAFYGEEYREHLQKEQNKEWMKENEEDLIRNLGEDKYRLLKNNKVFEDYNSAGVYDVEDIIAGEKFRDKRREEGYTCDTDDVIRAVKIANQIGDYDGMSAKSKKEAEDTLRRNYMENNPDTSKESVERFMNDQIKFIKEINSDKKKMI